MPPVAGTPATHPRPLPLATAPLARGHAPAPQDPQAPPAPRHPQAPPAAELRYTPGRDHRTIPIYRDVTAEQWNDWKWQARNVIRTVEQLREVAELTPDEETAIQASFAKFRMGITPYYAALMDPADPADPVRRQSVPAAQEMLEGVYEMDDPLHEDVDSPVPGLTHRYPDRVLFLITDYCTVYCRHCTRRRLVGGGGGSVTRDRLAATVDYLRRHSEVRDVLISGGDAFLVGDEKLDEVLGALRSVPSIEVIRFGTRVPVVIPQRVTDRLCKILRKHHPIWVNTHFNHPKEITPEARLACERLADAGVPLGNQTVLMRGINDCPVVMRKLVHELLRIRVRPYYIYQCDLSEGLEHFRTPVSRGVEIIEMLRGHTSGFAVPTFVVDAPGGGGKIPIMPNYVVSQAPGRWVLRNFEGNLSVYHEPVDAAAAGYGPGTGRGQVCPTCGTDHASLHAGLGHLLYDGAVAMENQPIRRR